MNYSLFSNIKYIIKKVFVCNKYLIAIFAIFTICSSILPILNLYIPKFIIDELTGARDINQIVLFMVIFLIVGIILSYLMNYLKNITYKDFHEFRCICLQEYQEKYYNYEMRDIEDSSFLNKLSTARICLYDNNKGFEGILRKFFTLFGYIFSIIYFSISILIFNPFILALLLLNTIMPYILSYKIKEFEYSKQEELSYLGRKQSYINDIMSDFSYAKELQIFNLGNWMTSIIDNINIKILKINKDIINKQIWLNIINIMINLIREGLVYGFLVFKVVSGSISLGDFTLYFGMIISFSSMLNMIIDDVNHIRAQSLLVTDYRIIMDMPDQVHLTDICAKSQNGCSIEFDKVSFSYPGSDTSIFNDLSVKIHSNEKIAIVGTNGCGKSTFVKLACGFYTPTKGRVLIDGVDISKHNHKSTFKLFSALFQDISIFSLSIAENITYKPIKSINKEKMDKSIDKANFMKKINLLKKGVDTKLKKIFDADGIELSGGEIQKLAMARTLYKNGNIFVLDEPTSALDPIAEQEIYEQFNSITDNKTCLFITHRLASTRFCDRIFVLRDGKVAEIGIHDELMKFDGIYKEMFNLQSSYYNDKRSDAL